jgi:RNA polymerase sigma factor (sigma-70 family)
MHSLEGNAGTPALDLGEIDAGDLRLIHGIARGDREAFKSLYLVYFPRLTRFLSRMTRKPELIEELVNDTMLVVWNKADTFDGTCKVSTWVFAIAYRKACKAIHALDEPLADEPECEAAPDSRPDWQFASARRRQAVAAAIATLPSQQRMVVQLTYFHDMGYADIAKVLDCPENTVKTRMFHARRRLAVLLADQLEEEA